MYAKYDRKKDTVIIEMPKAEFATVVAAVGITSTPKLEESTVVNATDLGNPHLVYETITPLYRTMKTEGVY